VQLCSEAKLTLIFQMKDKVNQMRIKCQRPPILYMNYINYIKRQPQYKFHMIIKSSIRNYDYLIYYYTKTHQLSLFVLKIFGLLEIQANIVIIRAKLVPYHFIIEELCFYRLVKVNGRFVTSGCYVTCLGDQVNVDYLLYQRFYIKQYQHIYVPSFFKYFFKYYWRHFLDYSFNKIWTLHNFIVSSLTAQVVIYDFPHPHLFIAPFRRFTNLYYRAAPYNLNVVKIKTNHQYLFRYIQISLFEPSHFYKIV
jgi:hypothetical protein